ncbi:MAG: hypothetical protein QOI71_269 [Gaiellales bacterium]|nr:hypothetical protein [Gaiellales bacterium]
MTDAEQTEQRTRREPDEPEGGSGTAGAQTPEKDQAGSYARDAEQDPADERHGRADADRKS